MNPTVDRALHLTSKQDVQTNRSEVSDRSAPGLANHLADEDLQELRCAIELSMCGGGVKDLATTEVDDDLRKSLRLVCAKARLQRVHAEHLVIDLKHVWMSIPAMAGSRTAAKLSEIISVCISEYYEKTGTPPS